MDSEQPHQRRGFPLSTTLREARPSSGSAAYSESPGQNVPSSRPEYPAALSFDATYNPQPLDFTETTIGQGTADPGCLQQGFLGTSSALTAAHSLLDNPAYSDVPRTTAGGAFIASMDSQWSHGVYNPAAAQTTNEASVSANHSGSSNPYGAFGQASNLPNTPWLSDTELSEFAHLEPAILASLRAQLEASRNVTGPSGQADLDQPPFTSQAKNFQLKQGSLLQPMDLYELPRSDLYEGTLVSPTSSSSTGFGGAFPWTPPLPASVELFNHNSLAPTTTGNPTESTTNLVKSPSDLNAGPLKVGRTTSQPTTTNLPSTPKRASVTFIPPQLSDSEMVPLTRPGSLSPRVASSSADITAARRTTNNNRRSSSDQPTAPDPRDPQQILQSIPPKVLETTAQLMFSKAFPELDETERDECIESILTRRIRNRDSTRRRRKLKVDRMNELEQRMEELREENDELKEKIAELERRLGLTVTGRKAGNLNLAGQGFH